MSYLWPCKLTYVCAIKGQGHIIASLDSCRNHYKVREAKLCIGKPIAKRKQRISFKISVCLVLHVVVCHQRHLQIILGACKHIICANVFWRKKCTICSIVFHLCWTWRFIELHKLHLHFRNTGIYLTIILRIVVYITLYDFLFFFINNERLACSSDEYQVKGRRPAGPNSGCLFTRIL